METSGHGPSGIMLDEPVHLTLRIVTDPWDNNWFLNGLDFFPL